jgi:hypothetical protein
MERLVHPNVVTCAGSRIDSNDHVIIVMELMGLGDLRNYLLSKYDHDAVVGPTPRMWRWSAMIVASWPTKLENKLIDVHVVWQ